MAGSRSPTSRDFPAVGVEEWKKCKLAGSRPNWVSAISPAVKKMPDIKKTRPSFTSYTSEAEAGSLPHRGGGEGLEVRRR